MKKLLKSLPVKLIIAIIFGTILGFFIPKSIMTIIVSLKNILGQIINFVVPLIVIGFITPAIAKLGNNASRILGVALILAYMSSFLAAIFSMSAGYGIISKISFGAPVGLRELPKDLFSLEIPQIMSVMSALTFSMFVGLAAVWTKAKEIIVILEEFRNIVLEILSKIVIPVLPIFVCFTFTGLSYEGAITKQLPVFLIAVLLVVIGHHIWLTVLYIIAGIYSRKNPIEVIKHYGTAYITAIGTMSSAATMPIALRSAKKSKALRDDIVDFAIPLFASIHPCGSTLTEAFFVMTVSKVLYGELPEVGTMILFCALLAIFAIGAAGVPGGTVMASLGIITGMLGFGEEGTALMIAIYVLQSSFSTVCNVTGGGALTLILTGYAEKHKIEKTGEGNR